MITNFKIFEKIRRWEFKNDKYIYHYTGYKTVLKILEDGILKTRSKYLFTTDPNYEHDYGYVSFTESEDYHYSGHGIDTDVRFVFDKKYMNKKYDLVNFDANKEAEDIYYDEHGDVDDLQKQKIPFYGLEYEIRIYNDIPITDVIRLECANPVDDNLKELCKEKNIVVKEW